MAAPNLRSVTTVTGKTAYVALSSASMTPLLSNAASSGKVFKVNAVIVANVDGTNAADITLKMFSQDDIGGTGYAMASTVSVPADAAIVLLGKDTPIYLEEDRSLGVQASAANDLEVVVSYEEIS